MDALGLLGLLSAQDVECVDEYEGRFRLKRSVAKDRVVSVIDPDAQHVHKSRKHYIDGFKGHIAVKPDTEIITEATLGCMPKVVQIGHRVFGTLSILGHGKRTVIDF